MTKRESNVILVGIIVGIVIAAISVAIFGEKIVVVGVLGDLFLKALKMLVVPLVLASVICGITGLGDIRKLGRMGYRTVGYYAATTAIAVGIGMVVVSSIHPGIGVSIDSASGAEELKKFQGSIDSTNADPFRKIILSFVSDNIFGAFASGDMLPIIVFALIFGGVLTTLGDRGLPVIKFFDGLNEAMMQMVHLVMWFAPIGIAALVAASFAERLDTWQELVQSLGKYMMCVLVGLGVHAFVILPALCMIFAGRNPLTYLGAVFPAVITAWTTASSSATLPLTMECVEERAGVSKQSTQFVLPLGATINMDGTALYESVAAIFIAEAWGVPLTGTKMGIIFVTATLASIGAAGIPQAGIVTMAIVLQAAGLPLEGLALILPVDWFLDRFRTAVNVWGDSIGAAVIDKSMGTATPPSGQT